MIYDYDDGDYDGDEGALAVATQPVYQSLITMMMMMIMVVDASQSETSMHSNLCQDFWSKHINLKCNRMLSVLLQQRHAAILISTGD